MKKLSILAFLGLTLFASCTKDEVQAPAVVVDYSVAIEGVAPNAKLVITNKSSGGSTYNWTFGQGASISSSSDKTPIGIVVDKVGDLAVTLKVINGADIKELSSTVKITGANALLTYTNISFGQVENDPSFGRFFSTSEGKMYKQSEVNATNGPKIDLVYKGINGTFIFFENPTKLFTDLFTIPGATVTKVVNYNSGFLVTDFDSMNDDTLLSAKTIVSDNSIIGSLNFPLVVLFQNASGKKGAIKLTAINSERLLVDIKLQKY